MAKAKHPQFKQRLRHAREFREMTQAELTRRAGLNPGTVSHFETGQRLPSFHNLYLLAKTLEVSSDFLLGLSNK